MVYLSPGLTSCFAGRTGSHLLEDSPGWEGGPPGPLPKLCLCSCCLAHTPQASPSGPCALRPGSPPQVKVPFLLSQHSVSGCRTVQKPPAPGEGLPARGLKMERGLGFFLLDQNSLGGLRSRNMAFL